MVMNEGKDYGEFCKVLIPAETTTFSEDTITSFSVKGEDEEPVFIKIKVHIPRILDTNGAPSLEKLLEQVRAAQVTRSTQFRLRYRDEDGDLILLTTDETLKDALLNPPTGILKMELVPCGNHSKSGSSRGMGEHESVIEFTYPGVPRMFVEGGTEGESDLDAKLDAFQIKMLQQMEESARGTAEQSQTQLELVRQELHAMRQAMFANNVTVSKDDGEGTRVAANSEMLWIRKPCQSSVVRLELGNATCCGPQRYPAPERIYLGQSTHATISMVYWNVSRLVPGRYRVTCLYKGVTSGTHPSESLCVNLVVPQEDDDWSVTFPEGDPEKWDATKQGKYKTLQESVVANPTSTTVTLPGVTARPWHNLRQWRERTLGEIVVAGGGERQMLVIMSVGGRANYDIHYVDVSYVD